MSTESAVTKNGDTPTDVEALASLVDALRKGQLTLRERVEELEEQIEDAETSARQAEELAVTAFKTVSDQERRDETKVEVAKRKARDELLRRIVADVGAVNLPVSRSRIREMAKPEHALAHETIRSAFEQLAAEHECFRETTSQGNKALSIDSTKIPRELVVKSAASTGRDDVAAELLDIDSADLVTDVVTKTNISRSAATGGET